MRGDRCLRAKSFMQRRGSVGAGLPTNRSPEWAAAGDTLLCETFQTQKSFPTDPTPLTVT